MGLRPKIYRDKYRPCYQPVRRQGINMDGDGLEDGIFRELDDVLGWNEEDINGERIYYMLRKYKWCR